MRLNKRLSKQSWGWWFETLSRPLWRHCNLNSYLYQSSKHHPTKHQAQSWNLVTSPGTDRLTGRQTAGRTDGPTGRRQYPSAPTVKMVHNKKYRHRSWIVCFTDALRLFYLDFRCVPYTTLAQQHSLWNSTFLFWTWKSQVGQFMWKNGQGYQINPYFSIVCHQVCYIIYAMEATQSFRYKPSSVYSKLLQNIPHIAAHGLTLLGTRLFAFGIGQSPVYTPYIWMTGNKINRSPRNLNKIKNNFQAHFIY